MCVEVDRGDIKIGTSDMLQRALTEAAWRGARRATQAIPVFKIKKAKFLSLSQRDKNSQYLRLSNSNSLSISLRHERIPNTKENN